MGRIANGYRTPGLSTNCSAPRHHNAALHRGAWAVFFLVCAVATVGKGAPSSALLCIALAAYFAHRSRERLRLESSFRLGAQAEEQVGVLLEEAADWGWAVEHDVLKRGGAFQCLQGRPPELRSVLRGRLRIQRGHLDRALREPRHAGGQLSLQRQSADCNRPPSGPFLGRRSLRSRKEGEPPLERKPHH